MANLPGVSFLVPVYNKAPHLPAVLRQIARQTGDYPRQYVFVDDGSTDGSLEIVRELTADWDNTVIHGQSNKGSAGATNASISLADQPYTDAYVAEVLRARHWIVTQLTCQRVIYYAAGGNYLLLWPHRSSETVEAELRAAGILVRSMAGKPQIDGSLRISIGTTEQMQRFWQAYQAIDSEP